MNFVPLRRRVVVAATLAALAASRLERSTYGLPAQRPSRRRRKRRPCPSPRSCRATWRCGRILRAPGSGRARRHPLARRGRRTVGALRRGRAGQARRPARDDRPGSYARKSSARRRSGRGAGARHLHESEHERAQRLWNEKRHRAARARRARQCAAGSRRQPARRGGRAAVRPPEPRLYPGARAGVRPVGRLEITVGNLVAAGPGAPVLTTLVSVNPIYASFDADEQVVLRALKDLTQGIPVEMETAGGTTHRGRLQLIDNQVNARSGTVRVRAVFDNKDGSLIPASSPSCAWGRRRPSLRC